ncbi:MAG TPA: hypothetical protein VFE60_14000 [Roseiarcus sp.]|jgi:predicted SnoaL-like aldol condensation-catalyzing enzyme|nr:hypothetical protein [Roseiarcus sp.]
MSETNKDVAVAFYKKALFEGRVEDAFRLYAGVPYRQHNPLIEDGMEGVKKFVAWVMANHPDARCSVSLPTATTSSFTVIGTACPRIPAERRWWTSFDWKAARPSSTGT